jgi:hypothetical protein
MLPHVAAGMHAADAAESARPLPPQAAPLQRPSAQDLAPRHLQSASIQLLRARSGRAPVALDLSVGGRGHDRAATSPV